MNGPREDLERRLSACYLAAALFTAAAAMVTLSSQPREPLEATGFFWSAARGAYWGGVIYLLATVAAHMRRSFELKTGVHADNPARLWPGHSLVFVVAAFCLLRGASSRALLAGLDRLLAPLAVVSLLACLLAIVSWWVSARLAPEDRVSLRPSQASRAANVFFALTSAAAAASLACLEILSLPGTYAAAWLQVAIAINQV